MNTKSERELECPSVTYALKSKELLSNLGYTVRVKKLVRKSKGCGYSIVVRTEESTDYLLHLLWDNGIKASRLMDY